MSKEQFPENYEPEPSSLEEGGFVLLSSVLDDPRWDKDDIEHFKTLIEHFGSEEVYIKEEVPESLDEAPATRIFISSNGNQGATDTN